jgi:formylglycine-generating enzyme required for sulfatase activity
MKLTLIPGGTFRMGSPVDDKDARTDEKPQHEVRITRSFYLGVYEVTQAQYEAVMGHNPSYFSSNGGGKKEVAGQSTSQHPVEYVSWLDAVMFCNKLSQKEGLKPFYAIDGETVRVPVEKGPGYRLPTEAEWEYACRAGTRTRFLFGDDEAGLGEYGWYYGNSGGRTHPVGQNRANALGLFDMHGNVYEWCGDWFGARYYGESPAEDPPGPVQASHRVIRGGGWYNGPRNCRSAYRKWGEPANHNYNLGFRLALGQSGR